MNTLVGISTYNEIQALPLLVTRVFEELPECRLLVVDDNSPDGTGDWCRRYAETDDRLTLVQRPSKQGLGSATMAVLKFACDRQFDYCVTMDADLSHDPKYLRSMVAAMSEPTPVDYVIGSRYVAGGGVDGWPLRRRVMSRLINQFARSWLGLQPRDTSGAFRVYRVATLERLDFDQIKSQGYSVFEELLYRLKPIAPNFREVPITFVDRDLGESKITFAEAVRSVWQLLNV